MVTANTNYDLHEVERPNMKRKIVSVLPNLTVFWNAVRCRRVIVADHCSQNGLVK